MWKDAPLDGVMHEFLATVTGEELWNYVEFLHLRTADAVSGFEDDSIDLIHVDGNHTKEIALSDVSNYWPKVRPGGYMIADDTNWESLRPALEWLDGCGAILVGDYKEWRIYRKPIL